MLIELRVKNCFSFYDEVVFSMKADMRNKRLASNVYRSNHFNVLKTAGIYGANNTGKTCFVKCIRALRNILLNQEAGIIPNLFHRDDAVCSLGVSFLWQGREFRYDLKYNVQKREYPYERFSEILKDQYGNESEEIWLVKDADHSLYKEDKELLKMIPLVSQGHLLFYTIDVRKFNKLAEMKRIVTEFASKIDIVNMNNIPMERTINLMKNKNNLQNKVVEFIKNADLYMDNFEYADIDRLKIDIEKVESKPEEKVLDIPDQLMDQIRLVSVYKGVPVPTVLFDSTGTKKIIALASYVIEGLEQGRILVVDELDSSIHFILTRAIVAMFNNELNTNAQMIFTVHDINLMDCKRMFRKEQIWFVHKDKESVYLYSLAQFTSQQGVRDTTDIIEKYRKGILGAIPEPDLISTLLSIKGNQSEEAADEE